MYSVAWNVWKVTEHSIFRNISYRGDFCLGIAVELIRTLGIA